MTKKELTALAVHHTMAVTGGFFGVYALFIRNETFGSSETSNLIYLVVTGLTGPAHTILIRIGAIACYGLGIMFAVLAPKISGRSDIRFHSMIIDAVSIFMMANISADTEPVLALYPMFFATAVQWLSFMTVNGYTSATIFSTNNLRQLFTGIADYIYAGKHEDLKKIRFYTGSLLFFHAGVVYGWFCLSAWGIKSIYACLPVLALSLAALVMDRKTAASSV